MKKRALKKSKPKPSKDAPQAIPAEAAPPPQVVQISELPPVLTEGPHGEIIAMPHPEQLQIEADGEPNYGDLDQYSGVIKTLRNKRFSYREIAEWLSERGVPVDHNTVYRIHTKNLSDYQAAMEAEEDAREAEEEALRNQ